jgi:hypothetical protein
MIKDIYGKLCRQSVIETTMGSSERVQVCGQLVVLPQLESKFADVLSSGPLRVSRTRLVNENINSMRLIR